MNEEIDNNIRRFRNLAVDHHGFEIEEPGGRRRQDYEMWKEFWFAWPKPPAAINRRLLNDDHRTTRQNP